MDCSLDALPDITPPLSVGARDRHKEVRFSRFVDVVREDTQVVGVKEGKMRRIGRGGDR